MADVTFTGIDTSALQTTALALPYGQQKAKFCADIASTIGANPIFEVVVGSVVIYRSAISGTLSSSSAGVALPTQFVEPPSVTTANALSGSTAVIRVRHATNSGIYLSVPVIVGGNATSLTASKAHDGIQPIRTGTVLFLPPATLDVAPFAPDPLSADFQAMALRDMRKDPATGAYTYSNSFAPNDAKPYLRTMVAPATQYDRAQLSLSRYPTSTAFTTTNPDYTTDLSQIASDSPMRSQANWLGIRWYGQLYLSEAYAAIANKHAVGYQNNTRVLVWDCQVWVKRTNGTWERLIFSDSPGGVAWYPSQGSGGTSTAPDYDARVDLLSLMSYRTTPPTGVGSDNLYRIMRPNAGLRTWTNTNVLEVLALCKTALVKHNAAGVDDRTSSRFLFSVGADYFPVGTEADAFHYRVGASRHKYVTALAPSFQYHVMHTATWENMALSFPPITAGVPAGANESVVWLSTNRTLTKKFFGISAWTTPWDTNAIGAPANSYGINRYCAYGGFGQTNDNNATELTFLRNASLGASYTKFHQWADYHIARGADLLFQVYINAHGSSTTLTQTQWNQVETDFNAWLAQNNGKVKYVVLANEPLFTGAPGDNPGEPTSSGWPSRSATLYAQYARIIKQLINASAWAGQIKIVAPEMMSLDDFRRGPLLYFLAASAAGPDVGYGTGTGTTGKDWIDIIGFHGYHYTSGNFNPVDGGRSLILSLQSEMAAAGVPVMPLWDSEFMWTADKTLTSGGNMKDGSWATIVEQMTRRMAAEVATGVECHINFEWGSAMTHSYWNDNNAQGTRARNWWAAFVTWWTASPIGRIAQLTDNKIRVTRTDSQVLLIPDDLTNGKFGPNPQDTSSTTLIHDSGNFASTQITTNVGTGNQDRYLTGGDFDKLLFATSQTYSWWELAIVGGGNPSNATTYAETSFKVVTGPDGASRRVISLNIKADAPQTGVEQVRITDYQAQGLPGTGGRTEPVFHQRMWVKFDVNELTRGQRVGATNYYHIFWEIKAEPDYRFRIQLQYDNTLGKLYWVAHDDVLSNATRIHNGENKTVNVVLAPHNSALGWHLIEVLFNRPAGTWRCTVDGSNIINWTGGSLYGASGNIANFPMFMQNYSAVSMGGGFEGNMDVLFSDFKLWNQSPADAWQVPAAPPGGGAGWEPDDEAGLISWFDMSTPTTLDTVAKTWSARYGTKQLVSTSGTGPSKITNGFSTTNKGAAVFTSSSDTDLKIVNPGFTEVTVVVVLRFTSVGGGVNPTVWTRTSVLGVSGLLAYDFGGFSNHFMSGNPAEVYEPPWPDELIVVTRHSAASRIIRINGEEVVANSVLNTTGGPTSSEDFLLFPYPGSAQTMSVQVAAVGFFTSASWSTSLAQKIEGFIAHQGLGVGTAILPSGHPYKSSAP